MIILENLFSKLINSSERRKYIPIKRGEDLGETLKWMREQRKKALENDNK